jgi:hypothetical protein
VLCIPLLFLVQHKIEYQKSTKETTTFWETTLLLTLKRQDGVPFIFVVVVWVRFRIFVDPEPEAETEPKLFQVGTGTYLLGYT